MYSVDEFDETEPELEMLEWAGMVCIFILNMILFLA
jgi:hypothetical protein